MSKSLKALTAAIASIAVLAIADPPTNVEAVVQSEDKADICTYPDNWEGCINYFQPNCSGNCPPPDDDPPVYPEG